MRNLNYQVVVFLVFKKAADIYAVWVFDNLDYVVVKEVMRVALACIDDREVLVVDRG